MSEVAALFKIKTIKTIYRMTFQKLSRIVEAVYSVCSCSDCVGMLRTVIVTHIEMTDEMLFTKMYKLQIIQYKITIILIIYLYILLF